MLAEASSATRHDDRCTVTEIGHPGDDGLWRLVVCGDVDAVSARRLQQSLIDVLRRLPPGDIDVDVSGVTFLDAAGIEALLRCQADARQLECRLVLTRPSPMTYRVLQIAGLLAQFGLARPRPAGHLPGPAGAALGLVNCGLAG
jgi:anti-sigma B factor antagonist